MEAPCQAFGVLVIATLLLVVVLVVLLLLYVSTERT